MGLKVVTFAEQRLVVLACKRGDGLTRLVDEFWSRVFETWNFRLTGTEAGSIRGCGSVPTLEELRVVPVSKIIGVYYRMSAARVVLLERALLADDEGAWETWQKR